MRHGCDECKVASGFETSQCDYSAHSDAFNATLSCGCHDGDPQCVCKYDCTGCSVNSCSSGSGPESTPSPEPTPSAAFLSPKNFCAQNLPTDSILAYKCTGVCSQSTCSCNTKA